MLRRILNLFLDKETQRIAEEMQRGCEESGTKIEVTQVPTLFGKKNVYTRVIVDHEKFRQYTIRQLGNRS